MQTKIKKSNMILGILLMSFALVLASFVFEFGNTALFSETPSPSTLVIREHNNQPIQHATFGADLGCANCHLDAIDNDTLCIDLCHYDGGMALEPPIILDLGLPGGNVSIPHHNQTWIGLGGWSSCLSRTCHEDTSQPDDARYVVRHEADHVFCNGGCHDLIGHGLEIIPE